MRRLHWSRVTPPRNPWATARNGLWLAVLRLMRVMEARPRRPSSYANDLTSDKRGNLYIADTAAAATGSASARGRRVERFAAAATGGSLGDSRLDRQGRPHSNDPSTGPGEGPHRRLVELSRNLKRTDFQAGNACQHCLGRRTQREGRVARRHAVREKPASRNSLPMILGDGDELDQIQFLLGHLSVQTNAVNDRIGIEPKRRTGSDPQRTGCRRSWN